MSQNEKIYKHWGYHQEDMVDLLYYLVTGHASILNYLSTCGEVISTLITCLSAADGSNSATVLSISGKVSFPSSFTDICKVSVNLIQI